MIKALKQYTVTSSLSLQQQVLNLLAQLVQLRVNYCLLDSDQIFIGFVIKQFEFIEEGQIRFVPKPIVENSLNKCYFVCYFVFVLAIWNEGPFTLSILDTFLLLFRVGYKVGGSAIAIKKGSEFEKNLKNKTKKEAR